MFFFSKLQKLQNIQNKKKILKNTLPKIKNLVNKKPKKSTILLMM